MTYKLDICFSSFLGLGVQGQEVGKCGMWGGGSASSARCVLPWQRRGGELSPASPLGALVPLVASPGAPPANARGVTSVLRLPMGVPGTHPVSPSCPEVLAMCLLQEVSPPGASAVRRGSEPSCFLGGSVWWGLVGTIPTS